MTADIIAEQLGLGPNSIYVERGIVEEAKSFRGKTAAEPRPNWEPLILPVSELQQYSSRIDPSYVSLVNVQHYRDETAPNTVRECHDTLQDRDEITRDRCRIAIRKIINSEKLDGEVVLCVGHGAVVTGTSKELENGLPEELRITGDRCVSCFAEFCPYDPNNTSGPWKSVFPTWRSGNIFGGEDD